MQRGGFSHIICQQCINLCLDELPTVSYHKSFKGKSIYIYLFSFNLYLIFDFCHYIIAILSHNGPFYTFLFISTVF